MPIVNEMFSEPSLEKQSVKTTKKTKTARKTATKKATAKKASQKSPKIEQPKKPSVLMKELRQVLQVLMKDISSVLDKIPEEQAFSSLDPARIRESLSQAESFLHKPTFVVGFAGGFNAGKSMLINALLGQQILKDGAVPTTSTVTRITAAPEGDESLIVHFFTKKQFETLFKRYFKDFRYLYNQSFGEEPQSERESLTELLDEIKDLRERLEREEWNDRIRSLDSFYDLIVAYINHQQLLTPEPMKEALTRKNLTYYTTKAENSVAPLVREVQLQINHPMLAEGSELIDLPGLGSPDPRDEEITMEALKGNAKTGKRECDAVVHVMDSLSPFRAGEDHLFQIYRKVWGESFAKRVFLVVSRWGKLEQQSADEMLAVGKTIQRVAERYDVDRHKVFFVDGRIGANFENQTEEEEKEEFKKIREKLEPIREELEACSLPGGRNLFKITAQIMYDGNVPNLRNSLRYYLSFYKEYLHLTDALRVLESQLRKIQQVTSLHLPPLNRLEDDEDRFLEACKEDIESHLRSMRKQARELQPFLQKLLDEETLPNNFDGLCESLYQNASQRMEEQEPKNLKQQLLTSQIMQQGPLTNPSPWESFRFLLQKEVGRLDEELEHFCSAITERVLEQYTKFLYVDIGLQELLQRAFGEAEEGRVLVQKFNTSLAQLKHDLRLIARNMNRVFFYEYSDVQHRREYNDALVDIQEELAEKLNNGIDVSPSEASHIASWLLRQKMDYHFRKLGKHLPLCYLQQIEEAHRNVCEQIDEASYALRQSYFGRLERNEIGHEVDKIRHRHRQVKAVLEQLNSAKDRMTVARGLLQDIRPRV